MYIYMYTVNPGYSGNLEIVDKFKGFEKAPLFILSLYIVEFGYSGQIWPSGRVPLYRGLTVFSFNVRLVKSILIDFRE